MRVVGRRELQVIFCQLIKPSPQRRRAVEFGDDGCPLIDDVAADAAALFVPWQEVAIHRVAKGGRSVDQLRRNLSRQEILNMDKGTLPGIIAPQTRKDQGIQTSS